MSVYSLFVVSESGSLQFYYEHLSCVSDIEKTFNFPLEFCFKSHDGRIVIDFGGNEEVKNGYAVLEVNHVPVKGTCLDDGREIIQYFADEENFPLTIKFGRPRLRPNDRIQLASMFQPLHQMARFLSPLANTPPSAENGDKRGQTIWNSGIQSVETNACRVHCFESHTGVKFLMVTDSKLPSASRESLRRVYEAYTDYVLKNPFYSPNQPFNFEFFTNQVKTICEQVEKGM
ncbi:unnamed protein product [Calicophoron daubneyi]|uniref:Trafficking protein particle complex subunit n=1 Tax=Calicophoron daubneyi TaxID=300641 RepID=A0AAV2TI50_CALDB